MSDVCGIYCIRNKINYKKYIGQSINCRERMTEHKRQLRKNIHENEYLQRSWNKYGAENFEFFIISECEMFDLDKLETDLIEKLFSHIKKWGYNVEMGGNKPPSPKGKPKSDAWYINQRKAKLGHDVSEETRRKISEVQIGKTKSQKTKDKHRSNTVGRKINKDKTSSKYVGVMKNKRNNKWNAYITIGKQIYLGLFLLEEDAARAYDRKCWEYMHDLSKLNFPEDYINEEILENA
jgi:group I intron endonuclease